jgi:exodeoxyribonuclease VII large subunit
MANLRSTLLAWREQEALKKGVELFRVLPTTAIDDIVRTLPKTKEELTAIKGIKDAKFAAYGHAILMMVKEHGGRVVRSMADNTRPETSSLVRIEPSLPDDLPRDTRTIFSVSTYLDEVNRMLFRMHAPVRGEITSAKIQGQAAYFSLRDKDDGSALSVFMWNRDLELSGIVLEEGLEVIVTGRSEIYKPTGRYSLRAETIELVGEGAWKKAYDELKRALLAEGLCDVSRKRALPRLPERIGLITSKQGAVIHDFLNNLGSFGYHITFCDTRVEGALAVKDILLALRTMERKEIDLLVIVRGGGSLESLQAFNNERVVRAIANFPVPTICAIGHDKDVPLAQLVSDAAPSTPTATTILINAGWIETSRELTLMERTMTTRVKSALGSARERLISMHHHLLRKVESLAQIATLAMSEMARLLDRIKESNRLHMRTLHTLQSTMIRHMEHAITGHKQSLTHATQILRSNDPRRLLARGYALISSGGKVETRAKNLPLGATFEVTLFDGTLQAQVTSQELNPK